MSDNEFHGDPAKSNAKIARLLEHAVMRLPLADRVLAANHPGVTAQIVGESVEFTLDATDEVIAIADRTWIADDEDDSFDPEFIPTDGDFPPDLST